MQTTDNIRALFEKYISGMITPAEVEQLVEITDQYSNDELSDILEPVAMGFEKDPNFNAGDWEPVIRSILSHSPERKAKIIYSNWYQVAAAAVIVLFLSVGAYFYFNHRGEKQIAKTEPRQIRNDVAPPQSAKAILTLSDGSTIILDSAAKGSLAVQGNVNVVKTTDGQIVYEGNPTEVKYNTLTVPKGSKPMELRLSDGSEVWLNVASSITYPTAFVGNERKVQITGEAYFEVAHNASQPFVVSKGDVQVQVLGTHFNVNAYDDEAAIQVTLLEGMVKTSIVNGESSILKPGQQATVRSAEGNIQVKSDVDVDEVMAWKNGTFLMNRTDIGSIMRQIARWYDVDVVYENGVPKGTISGEVPRNLNLSEVLKVYEYSGLHFRIEGRKIIVMQ